MNSVRSGTTGCTNIAKTGFSYCVFFGLLLAVRARGLRLTAPVRKEDAPVGRLVVRKRNREFILDAGDIDRLEADGNYVVVHATGQIYRLRTPWTGWRAAWATSGSRGCIVPTWST